MVTVKICAGIKFHDLALYCAKLKKTIKCQYLQEKNFTPLPPLQISRIKFFIHVYRELDNKFLICSLLSHTLLQQ